MRHLAVAPNGDLFVAVEGGTGGLLVLRDADGDGRAETSRRHANQGATGLALSPTHVYLAHADRVVRWPWVPGSLEPAGPAEVIVRDLPAGGHHTKSLALEGDRLFVSIGSLSNSCQEADRKARSPGREPCPELATRAGIWSFSASRPGQRPGDGMRHATGLRNATGLAWHAPTRTLYATSHGRDQLTQNWGFPAEYGAENPAEEFGPVPAGTDWGWPYCYMDTARKLKVLAPEYGGDGEATGRCAAARLPAIGFPGHWAPMAIAFAASPALGAAYAEGAFIAFHGSWNRAPLPQAGYRVVFAPFRDGRATGSYLTVAQGREGPTALRAAGVAVGPDGALYISGDRAGTIWRIQRTAG